MAGLILQVTAVTLSHDMLIEVNTPPYEECLHFVGYKVCALTCSTGTGLLCVCVCMSVGAKERGGGGARRFLGSTPGDSLERFMADCDWPRVLGRASAHTQLTADTP